MTVSKNAYYHWLKTKDRQIIETPRMVLKRRIQFHFEQSKEIYGSARIQKDLEREGMLFSRSYIALVMREMGIKSVLRRKFVATTDSKHTLPIAANVLERDFNSNELGTRWVSDITYIRVADHWNYLTTIMDLADRKIVGWALSEDMTVDHTIRKAWLNACKTRSIKKDFIFHSDRGVQYASNKMTDLFGFNKKITQSMSRKGDCWDNAVAESFFKTIKYEWLYRFKYSSHSQLFDSINQYITWYNIKRLHSSLGYLSPLEMEIKLRGFYNNAA
jgi:transposase InsO family protein